MEDVTFDRSHSKSPLPEAGRDPDDPMRPEIDEENSTPNPPIGAPDQDMEVTEKEAGMPDPDDVQEAGLSDNESELSELNDDQFDDFDASNIAIEERPQVIDDSNVNLIGVHKRKRLDGEAAPKKKKKKADKPRRKKAKDAEVEGDGEIAVTSKRRSRKEGRVRGASPEAEVEEELTPEQRRKRALDSQINALIKPSGTRRRKKDGIDLEGMADAEIDDMRRRMTDAAMADNNGRALGEPARHKLKLLPEVVALLNRNTLRDSLIDPDTNILEAVRFFLEPLSDGSLPAYDIQKEIFGALSKLPVNKEALVASGIGKVLIFYCKSKRPELSIRRQAERLYTDWSRPILRRTDDYRKKEFAQADYDPSNAPTRSGGSQNSQAAMAAAARKKALEAPRAFSRARLEPSATTYTVVPKSNVLVQEGMKKGSGAGEDLLRKIKSRQVRR